MGKEDKFWVWVIALSLLFLFVLPLSLYTVASWKDIRMAELGFQKSTIQGYNYTVYQKAK